jgi:hypothetical protein
MPIEHPNSFHMGPCIYVQWPGRPDAALASFHDTDSNDFSTQVAA